jgi:hippurate hydrolase
MTTHTNVTIRLLTTLYIATAFFAGTSRGETPAAWVKEHLSTLVQTYRDLHQNPELSFHEQQTAARMARQLQAIGAEVTTDLGGHGVVGLLRNGAGPTVMIRTDLDGLPVVEQTGLAYSSQVRVQNDQDQEVGVMHACAHDIHMTCWVAVAQYLAEHRDAWQGTAMFVGQPAEERGAGALAMLKAGLFERFPKPDFALALHVDAALAADKVGCRAGYALANTDSVDITVKGRGGHGAYPHTTIDPIVQAAQLVVALQTIVSREIPPTEPAVITVGSIHGGTKHNVIADQCHLQLTLRSYSDTVREKLLTSIRRKANAIAASMEAPEPVITVTDGTPALYNDDQLNARVERALRQALGDENVTTSEQSMGGEDFSQYGRAGVPIVMFRLGTIEPRRLERFKQLGQAPPSLHSAQFYPDAELTLTTGIVAMTSAVLDLMPPRKP